MENISLEKKIAFRIKTPNEGGMTELAPQDFLLSDVKGYTSIDIEKCQMRIQPQVWEVELLYLGRNVAVDVPSRVRAHL
jgi:hypothetical protein